MKNQPELNELCIIGTTSRLTHKFCASDLARRFVEFKGALLVFRRALFTKMSIPVLSSIGGKRTITSLVFDRSKLHFDPWGDDPEETLPFPLFPSVKRIKYVGAPLESLWQLKIENFIALFMTNCQLTHFELSYGFQASCCGAKENDGPNWDGKVERVSNNNGNQFLTMSRIYDALHQFSQQSLQIFLDRDPILLNWAARDPRFDKCSFLS
jgi:hypothetical protein